MEGFNSGVKGLIGTINYSGIPGGGVPKIP
jgi:hypothetical protein